MITHKPTLHAVNLSRSFGTGAVRSWALRDASLELRRGEIVLLMGPSGSGKSTLLAVLSGLLQPETGQVFSLGQDLWRLSESQRERFRLRECGFIFQGYNLFPALTAAEQLEIVLRWGEGMRWSEARRQALAMLDRLGLAGKEDLRPNQMSGGEKQRVAIGRALVKQPTFCFADEPTSALDWSHGEEVVRLLQAAAHERGATVLVVSHDPRVMAYVDRVLHIEDGTLTKTEQPHLAAPLAVRDQHDLSAGLETIPARSHS